MLNVQFDNMFADDSDWNRMSEYAYKSPPTSREIINHYSGSSVYFLF
jgi:hypothetical protein